MISSRLTIFSVLAEQMTNYSRHPADIPMKALQTKTVPIKTITHIQSLLLIRALQANLQKPTTA